MFKYLVFALKIQAVAEAKAAAAKLTAGELGNQPMLYPPHEMVPFSVLYDVKLYRLSRVSNEELNTPSVEWFRPVDAHCRSQKLRETRALQLARKTESVLVKRFGLRKLIMWLTNKDKL
jgi:hypothetical protein